MPVDQEVKTELDQKGLDCQSEIRNEDQTALVHFYLALVDADHLHSFADDLTLLTQDLLIFPGLNSAL